MTRQIVPRSAGARVPLSPAHVRMWNYLQPHGGWSTRPCASTIRIVGKLHAELLRKSIQTVVHRHESLRTRFVEVDGLPYQCVDPPAEFDLVTVDVAEPAEVTRLITDLCREKVNISRGPLFVARLFRLSEGDHILVCALDHMISDGTSMGILDRELWTVYRQLSCDLPLTLPPLSVQFGDYCVWLEENNLSWRDQHLEYWNERLRGVPELRLPRTDATANSSMEAAGKLSYFPLGKDLSDRLRKLAEQQRAPVAWLLLAVYAVALSRWCRQKDLLIKFVSHGRYREELRPMIGLLVSYAYLRLNLEGDLTFTSLVREIQRQVFLAVQHEDYNRVTDVLADWGVHTDGYFNWLPEYGAQGDFDFGQTGSEEFRLQPFPYRVPGSSFLPLFSDGEEGITLIVDFKPSVFPRSVVDKFAADIQWLAQAFSEQPLASVADYLDLSAAR